MVGGAVAVKSATLASELEQPDKTEPTEAIPKAEEGRPVPGCPLSLSALSPSFT
jgi:hypothetical protein